MPSGSFNGVLANKVLDWFTSVRIISGMADTYNGFSFEYLNGPKKESLIRLVKSLDLAIDDMYLEQGENEELTRLLRGRNHPLAQEDFPLKVMTLYSSHTVYRQDGTPAGVRNFVFGDAESDGSQKLFSMSGHILDTLEKGNVFIVDELDARLHPAITIKLIEIFNSSETNPNNAQLIFTTHDINVLDKKFFRRDQIWFTEKDRFGASSLFSLADYKIRNDSSYSANYMKGKYGAIPYLNLDPLLEVQ